MNCACGLLILAARLIAISIAMFFWMWCHQVAAQSHEESLRLLAHVNQVHKTAEANAPKHGRVKARVVSQKTFHVEADVTVEWLDEWVRWEGQASQKGMGRDESFSFDAVLGPKEFVIVRKTEQYARGERTSPAPQIDDWLRITPTHGWYGTPISDCWPLSRMVGYTGPLEKITDLSTEVKPDVITASFMLPGLKEMGGSAYQQVFDVEHGGLLKSAQFFRRAAQIDWTRNERGVIHPKRVAWSYSNNTSPVESGTWHFVATYSEVDLEYRPSRDRFTSPLTRLPQGSRVLERINGTVRGYAVGGETKPTPENRLEEAGEAVRGRGFGDTKPAGGE